MKIGFIGLGIMGRHMARHLLAGGHALSVLQHRSPVPQELLDAGATVYASAQEIAAGADLVILMLPDTPDVEAVLFGETGVAAGLSTGTIVMDMSSIDPIASRAFGERLRSLGCGYVDAPVSGGEIAAEAASLTIMVGASEEDFARVEPVLGMMGSNITRIGGVGDGQTAKVANQIIVGLTIAAVAEALAFAREAGADAGKVREALMGGFASSRILDVHGKRMLERTFDPGFKIKLHAKDLRLALNAGHSLGMPMSQTEGCQELMTAAIDAGDAEQDHSALIRVIERMTTTATKEVPHA